MFNVWLIETLVIFFAGSLLHFMYVWSGRKRIMGIFAAVNESTWEHIKLALSAIFLCTLVDVWFLGSEPNYWLAKNLSFLAPVVVIPILFYGYRAILKVKSCLPIDIAIFGVAAAISSLVFVIAVRWPSFGTWVNYLSGGISVVILTAYLSLTRFPLHNFLFRDPVTGKYGLEAGEMKVRRKKNKKSGR